MYAEIAHKLLKVTKTKMGCYLNADMIHVSVKDATTVIHWAATSGVIVPVTYKVAGDKLDFIAAERAPSDTWCAPDSESSVNHPLWEPVGALNSVDNLWTDLLACGMYTTKAKLGTSLDCVFLARDRTCMVATDGHRLNLIDCDYGQTKIDTDILFPVHVLDVGKCLCSRLESVEVFRNETRYYVRATWEGKKGGILTAWWELTDIQKYPNFNNIIANDYSKKIKFNGSDLHALLKKAKPLVDSYNKAVLIKQVDGNHAQVVVTNKKLDITDEVVGTFDVECHGYADVEDGIDHVFNRDYLECIFTKKSGSMTMRFGAPLRACLVDMPNGIHLIMPINRAAIW